MSDKPLWLLKDWHEDDGPAIWVELDPDEGILNSYFGSPLESSWPSWWSSHYWIHPDSLGFTKRISELGVDDVHYSEKEGPDE